MFGSKRAQVTIFVIIAVVIVAGVAIYFLVRNSIPSASVQVPQDFQPIYNSFLSCVENNVNTGISILESQGGYIYLPNFESGSTYQPFSSDLVFLGNPIPYWYYISGNNIPRNQVPNETFMQSQLAQFIDSKIKDCNLYNYTNFQITEGNPQSSVTIQSNKVQVNLQMDLTLRKGNQSVTIKNHKVTVNSELGNLFSDAKKVYNYEQSTQFLENYTIDVLRNYAPVTGVDIQCSPKTWNATSIFGTLKSAITNNIISLHTGENKTNYFTLPLNVPGVNFITNPGWPSSYSVSPTEGNILLAQPIGNQAGLGVLGFCYVPYHFVYSVKYPVLTTIKSGNEIFQFPMAVVIENNLALGNQNNGTVVESPPIPLCSQGKEAVNVSVFDSNSNPVDANISYECFGQTCNIGQTNSGSLEGNFPQCANGYVIASAQGYQQGKYMFSTVRGGSLSVVLDKVYPEKINLLVGGKPYSGKAVINFDSSGGNSQTVVYPNQDSVNLSQGNYNIQVYLYENSSIKVGATSSQQCVNIPASGASSQQQCFNVDVPSQVVSSALSGGGHVSYYVLETDLSGNNAISLGVPSTQIPTSINQIQTNYNLVQNQNITVNFS